MATATLLQLDHQTKYIKPINFSTLSIKDIEPQVTIQEILPFRVKFTSITIDGYTKTNPPPIPLQVIGYSNYIL